MKKIIAAILSLTMLSSSIAFAADSTNHSKLSAFQNVKTTAVSTDEMNKVSGEFLPLIMVGLGILGFGAAGKITNKIQCGTWTCKAY